MEAMFCCCASTLQAIFGWRFSGSPPVPVAPASELQLAVLLPALQVQARYSFLYRKINGEWLITEHHSSAMPEPVAEQELTAAGKGTE
jgi:hypothetical protein